MGILSNDIECASMAMVNSSKTLPEIKEQQRLIYGYPKNANK
jgi:hypothetical protein